MVLCLQDWQLQGYRLLWVPECHGHKSMGWQLISSTQAKGRPYGHALENTKHLSLYRGTQLGF